ncbi:FAD-dependent monooxygenase [Mycolicibacterium sp.]|uniref:FAD-dependent monooxygenase n=2 Tax=Mycolicibacterium sp. TaxID=2320850 RepID=UPI003D0AE642
MPTIRILISGAGIAGLSLAHWLHRYGFEVTVVEKADGIRGGGQAVDFKGPVHRGVLTRMGILDAVRRAHVDTADAALVNSAGRRIGTLPGAFAAGEINIRRGELVRILHHLTAHTCEYLFGDEITSLNQTRDGVDVTFARAAPRTFDIVVGADGIHSSVRALAFGPESTYVQHLGYHYALATLDVGDDDVMYNEPARMAALGGSKAPAFFVFASDESARDGEPAQKAQLIDAYAGSRWRVPELMAEIPNATEFHMDTISRVSMNRYVHGRVVLVGDSAYGNALGGYGTGLALVGAYVLAGELYRARGDHETAFSRYETLVRDYAAVSQKVNAGRLLAPRTRLGILGRNIMFSALAVFAPLVKILDRPASNIDLVDYLDPR